MEPSQSTSSQTDSPSRLQADSWLGVRLFWGVVILAIASWVATTAKSMVATLPAKDDGSAREAEEHEMDMIIGVAILAAISLSAYLAESVIASVLCEEDKDEDRVS